MSDTTHGTVGWVDLTVPNATNVRDFYTAVVGWTPQDVPVGDYVDFSMNAPNGETVAGICHARGSNVGIPAQWLIYVTVPDLATSLAACVAMGGRIYRERESMGGYGDFAVVQDPAGAVMGLIQPRS